MVTKHIQIKEDIKTKIIIIPTIVIMIEANKKIEVGKDNKTIGDPSIMIMQETEMMKDLLGKIKKF